MAIIVEHKPGIMLSETMRQAAALALRSWKVVIVKHSDNEDKITPRKAQEILTKDNIQCVIDNLERAKETFIKELESQIKQVSDHIDNQIVEEKSWLKEFHGIESK